MDEEHTQEENTKKENQEENRKTIRRLPASAFAKAGGRRFTRPLCEKENLQTGLRPTSECFLSSDLSKARQQTSFG
jgi:hypothetical protein